MVGHHFHIFSYPQIVSYLHNDITSNTLEGELNNEKEAQVCDAVIICGSDDFAMLYSMQK